jgi:hypothetical protein
MLGSEEEHPNVTVKSTAPSQARRLEGAG